MIVKPKIEGRCSEHVHNPGTTVTFHQCTRKAIRDGFCNLHHPDSVEKRLAESSRRWEERRKKDPLVLAYARIKVLEKEVRQLRKKLKASI